MTNGLLRMSGISVVCWLIAFVPNSSVQAQEFRGFAGRFSNDAELQQVAEDLREKYSLPGLAIATVRDGEIERLVACGRRKFDVEEAFTIQDVVHLGSCTKAMTSTLAAILVSDGVLTWDSLLIDVLPELKDKIPFESHAITLNHLLTHTGGVPANGKWWMNKGVATYENRLQIAIDGLNESPKEPGQFLYSNFGYLLAGLMMEKVTGKSWEELIRTRLFEPLQMNTAGFGPPSTGGSLEQPWGHRKVGELIVASQIDNAPSLGPAGTVHCSIRDWVKFLRIHMELRTSITKLGPELLNQDVFFELHHAASGNHYAKGWVVKSRANDNYTIGHGGSNTTWFVYTEVWPKGNQAIIFATNIDVQIGNQAYQEFRSLFDE
ncbi:MAG TPA: serine hydrolase domain-containing protein [Pirellulaceae bacterium]|nr:serine hydrolase domain-containing protein [Pirellulaceae bacterium]HMO91588.1 serine hydrolase domain-containing protein [Pirellulaceae bacterium]HMP68285.1 serine hydrolase domain-containing protein [Pirellulaceae bacterium]